MDYVKPLKEAVRCIHFSCLISRISPFSVQPCTIFDVEPIHSAVKVLPGPCPSSPKPPAFAFHPLLSYETPSCIYLHVESHTPFEPAVYLDSLYKVHRYVARWQFNLMKARLDLIISSPFSLSLVPMRPDFLR